ncbi:MAG: hypothetical protein HYX53_02240, partial [Chloroflexi bacterium]|nr:hypothetical protein [Chloroflexota bacterium]
TKKAFHCGICAREGRALLVEAVGVEDEERTARLEERGLAYWQLVERFGQDAPLGESVAALYTPRNLSALMATLRAVETALHGDPARDVMKLCLLEVIVSGSRLNAVAGQGAALRIEKGRAKRGHASQVREINVWVEYERTVRELAGWLATHRDARASRAPFVDLDPGAADLVLAQASPDDALGGWSHVAAVLLGIDRTGAAETLDGRIPARERTLRLTRQALLDAHRHAREDARAVIYVPHADLAAIAAVALAGAGAGWQPRAILYQPDALGGTSGAAAVVELERDAVLLRDQPPASAMAIEQTIRAAVRDVIVARGGPVEPERAGAAALEALAAKGMLGPLALTRSNGVSELEAFMDHFRSALADGGRDGIVRVGETVQRYDLEVVGDRAPLDDRVEWAVWGLLSSSREIDTRSVLKRVYALFHGQETPDRELVERCLASYGAQRDDGMWAIRDADALVQRQAEQTRLAARLVDCGHRLGFMAHVGRDLQRRPLPEPLGSNGQTLLDMLTEEEREAHLGRHVRGSAEALRFVDVVWYGKGKMVFLWHIDWTARLHRPIVDIGEAITDDENAFRFVAVPEERKGLVVLKLSRAPALAEVARSRGWRFVKWAPLRSFASDASMKLSDLEQVLGLEPAVERSAHQLVFKW